VSKNGCAVFTLGEKLRRNFSPPILRYVLVRKYFEAVTLGAFSLRDAVKNKRFVSLLGETKWSRLLLHFLIITIALNFPVIFVIARLPPYELFTRLYGDSFTQMLPEAGLNFLMANEMLNESDINEFNLLMMENGYGRNIMLPLLGMASGLVLILQTAFYTLAAFFLGLSRMNGVVLSFRERLGLLLFSSTLPVLLAALFGLYLPTVHIIVFYFAVILLGFYRSGLCQKD
jgi:hypothetical protein